MPFWFTLHPFRCHGMQSCRMAVDVFIVLGS